jgi:stage IV sporulation protein FB
VLFFTSKTITLVFMSWSFSIGRLFGSELRIHATFFLLLAWIGAAAWIADGPAAALSNVIFILALFACVVAHEFGHALTARRYGIRTPDITLLPIGGMARLERMPEKPAQEIIVALAGPAVNIVIWALITVLLSAELRMSALQSIEDPSQGFVARLAAINLFLALFNLLPAFPMDGGRVLRATLSVFMDRVRATSIAARAGQTLAFAFGFIGLISGNPILLLIGVFIFLAAAAESSDVNLRDRSHGVPARSAMITAYESLVTDDTLDAAGQALIRTTQAEFPVFEPQGGFAGFLTRKAIMKEAQENGQSGPVSKAMTRDIPSVLANAPLDDVLDGLAKPGVPAVAITDQNGGFLGYITRENIGEWLIVSRKRA